MGYYQQKTFIDSGGVVSGVQVRRQSALGATKDAFHLPTSPVFLRGKVTLHLAAISATGRDSRSAAVVDRNDRFGNLPVFAAATMMLFGVVGSIAQQATDSCVFGGLLHGRQKAGRIIAGAATDDGRQDEVASMIDHNGELEVAAETAGSAWTSTTINEVAAGIVSFKTGRINADFTRRGQQFEFSAPANDLS
jgi:hypothetical protein